MKNFKKWLLSWFDFFVALFKYNTKKKVQDFLLNKFDLFTLVRVVGACWLSLIAIKAVKSDGMTETLKIIIQFIKDIAGMI